MRKLCKTICFLWSPVTDQPNFLPKTLYHIGWKYANPNDIYKEALCNIKAVIREKSCPINHYQYYIQTYYPRHFLILLMVLIRSHVLDWGHIIFLLKQGDGPEFLGKRECVDDATYSAMNITSFFIVVKQ